jgi:hypothetical protein
MSDAEVKIAPAQGSAAPRTATQREFAGRSFPSAINAVRDFLP